MTAQIHLTRTAEHVVRIEMDAPPTNALGAAMRDKLLAVLDEVEADLSVRAVILTGRGKAFCSGDDLRAAAGNGRAAPESLKAFNHLLGRVESLRPATVAAVNGWAVGGGLELALCCDIRIAAQGASFTGAGVNVGLMASVARLPRLIGAARAKAMLLTGLSATAAEALASGLVTAVHSAEALEGEAQALAERIASRAPLSVEAAKRHVAAAFDAPLAERLAAFEEDLERLAATEDHANAVKSFAAREQPVFRRR